MGSETPVRNQFGTIIGLQPKEEADQVQATLDASMKAVGVEPKAETAAPPQPIPIHQIIIGGVIVLAWVVALVLFTGRTQQPPTVAPVALQSPTASPPPTPNSTPTATIAPTMTPEPTAVPTEIPTVEAFSPPPVQDAAPALTYCADRSSIWGNTHQCSSSQAAADALADSEIGAINEHGQATATALSIHH